MKSETKADLRIQLKRALNGAPSAVEGLATDSGSKDKHFQHFVDIMQAASSKVREDRRAGISAPTPLSEKDEVREMLGELRSRMPENLFNPVLEIDGT